MMIWYKMPYKIILLASVLPWIAAFFDKKWITYFPILLVLFLFLVFETLRKKTKLISINNNFYSLLTILLISVSWQLITGIGLGSGGLIIIIVSTFVFYKFFKNEKNIELDKVLVHQIKNIYLLHITFIFGELIFRIFGGTDIIFSLVGSTTEVMKYKMYNKARFLHFIGFSDMTGLGGLLLGSQGASQVALFSVFLFAPFYTTSPFYKDGESSYSVFIFSIIVLLCSITMTASILFMIMFIGMVFFIPISKFKSFGYKISIGIFSTIFLTQITSLLLFNIKNAYDLFVYYNSFMTSARFYFQLNIVDKFFGLGKNTNKIMTSSLDLPQGVTPADFGIGMLFNSAGIVLFGFFIFFIFKLFLKIRFNVILILKYSIKSNVWIWLGVINIFLAVGWLLSLIHYTPAVELGGREIFAFHLSCSIISLEELKKIFHQKSILN